MRLHLKEVRESQFLTQRELAAKADVGVSTIVRLEKGHQRPTFQTIKRLAAALGIAPSELVVPDGS
ncbi:MAG: helix-turn-helix transcriptional regulator [Chloroflexi bacterium]|nr:helix-turn-helix transcriptional regulator [Chloroflexota bacterium]